MREVFPRLERNLKAGDWLIDSAYSLDGFSDHILQDDESALIAAICRAVADYSA
jgi:hypothetical protein